MLRVLVLSIFALCAHASEVDIYAFGLSYHRVNSGYQYASGKEVRTKNPGVGAGVMWPMSSSIEVGGVAGWYTDSEAKLATFAMPTIRATWENRLCADLSAGYFNGSMWHGVGGMATVGVRTIGPIWVQGMYAPMFGQHYSVGIVFLRMRL